MAATIISIASIKEHAFLAALGCNSYASNPYPSTTPEGVIWLDAYNDALSSFECERARYAEAIGAEA